MTIFWILFIIFIVATISFIIWQIKQGELSLAVTGIVLCGAFALVFLIVAIAQPISIRQEEIRQDKEREQIVYQIENLTEESDKIKLNEWILTYNDWVNDINTSKEVYGWFSWYRDFDMTEHTIIDLV